MNIRVATASSTQTAIELSAFAHDVSEGLSRQPKQLPPKYFYNAEGSALFEQITRLPEYYPTRTELSILREHAPEIASVTNDGAALIEFGAGAATKARLLLREGRFAAYVPVDISGDFLNAEAIALRHDFPALAVHPVVADFTQPFDLPDVVADKPKVGFFPGSTLGNFDPRDARALLRTIRKVLGRSAKLVIGIDLEKDTPTLEAAYNDAAGVTAQFNLNVLRRINAELGGSFNLSAFAHRAIYNAALHRIEMHLVSRSSQTFRVLSREYAFAAGETIHTESSYKYSLERFTTLAASAGWTVTQSWTDDHAMFAVHVLASN